MSNAARIAIVVVLALVVATVIVIKRGGTSRPLEPTISPLPRLVDLGSTTCIPCKMMAPILEELRQEYAGQLQVDFIDVAENRKAASDFGVRVIPTQIFFDASGKELWRHTGFIAKEAILAKWRELGVPLEGPSAPAAR